MNERENPIVFAYYHNGEFQGFRADTFNTISKDYAKIYSFSREQVDTVLSNVKNACNRVGTAIAESIKKNNMPVVNSQGQDLRDVLLTHLSKTEETLRNWGEFEIRVHNFPKGGEFNELGEGDEWKREEFIRDLEPAIEVHKFKVMEFEN